MQSTDFIEFFHDALETTKDNKIKDLTGELGTLKYSNSAS
jgi:hypothetical protein